LQVAWNPLAVSLGSVDPTNWLNNVIIDLHGSSRTLLNVDYSQSVPALKSAIVTSTSDPAAIGEFTNGYLQFYLSAPLTGVRTGVKLDIFVLARAKPDMRFFAPHDVTNYFNGDTLVPIYLNELRFQGKLDGDAVDELNARDLVDNKVPYNLVAKVAGEEFLSVKALVQKFAPYVLLRMDTAGLDEAAPLPVYPNPPFNTADVSANYGGDHDFSVAGYVPFQGNRQSPWTWFGYYKQLFVGTRGSTRVKCLPSTDSSDVNAGIMRLAATTSPLGSPNEVNSVLSLMPSKFHFDIQPLTRDSGAEFTFPAYQDLLYYNNRQWDDTAAVSSARRNGLFNANFDTSGSSTITSYCQVYIAAGSDVSFVRFRKVPAFNLNIDS